MPAVFGRASLAVIGLPAPAEPLSWTRASTLVLPRCHASFTSCCLPILSPRGRARLTELGFTLAADARYPYGAACVFFRDDTYIEPLADSSCGDCEAAAEKGNVFVARGQAFRFRRPEGLFSLGGGDRKNAIGQKMR